MPAKGITLDSDAAERWLLSNEGSGPWVELRVPGHSSRPPSYLTWLRGGPWPVLLRAPLPDLDHAHAQSSSLAAWREATTPGALIHPLAGTLPDPQGATRFLPLRRSAATLSDVAHRVRLVTGRDALPRFLEPLSFPADPPAELDPVEFGRRLCLDLGARLLLDAGTMVAAARNGHGAIDAWLRGLEPGMVGALRVGAVFRRSGRWLRGREGEIDSECLDVLGAAAARWHPDVVLLEAPASVDDERALDALMVRTDEAVGRRPGVQVPAMPPSGRVRPAQDASLHVLDDEGVVFLAGRQELSIFNTTATFLWCLLEEGRDVHDLVEACVATFGVASADATTLVADALRDWFGRGYVDAPGPLAGTPVPFSRALAYLVLHAPHRDRFRADPMALARAFGLADEADLLAFAGIDPSDLDILATECAPDRRALDGPATPARSSAPRLDTRPAHALAYRLLGTNFCVRTEDRDLARQIERAWPQLTCRVERIDVDIEVRRDDGNAWTLVEDGVVTRSGLDRRAVVPTVKETMRRRGAERFPSVLNVHAAAVSFGHGAVLLPAAPGSGKTTLSAALVHAGATYFTDEIAPLVAPAFELAPVPLSLTVKSGAIGPLRSRYAGLEALEPHVREDRIEVRYLPPPASAVAVEQARERVRWIVFPGYVAGGDTRLTAIGRPSALRRMLDESYMDRRRLTPALVEGLVRWLRQTECFELAVGSLDEAVTLVRDLATH